MWLAFRPSQPRGASATDNDVNVFGVVISIDSGVVAVGRGTLIVQPTGRAEGAKLLAAKLGG